MNLTDVSIYDEEVLPKLALPYTINRTASRKYLGNRYLEESIFLDFALLIDDIEQMEALYTFWQDDCESGTKEFALKIDILGIETNNGLFLVSWVSDMNFSASSFENFNIKIKVRLEYKLDAFNDAIEI